jgi:hypothetical protein
MGKSSSLGLLEVTASKLYSQAVILTTSTNTSSQEIQN